MNIKSIRTIGSLILAMVIIFANIMSYSEGLLPSLSETVGIAMPSLGEALQRYPDSEIDNDDGSITELYTNVSETDFNTFSVYLKSQGAELADYKVEGSVLTAEIKAKDVSFRLSYNSKSGEAKVIYPKGTYDERIKNAKTHFDAGKKLLEEGKKDEAIAELLLIPQYNKFLPVVDFLQKNNLAAATREKKLAPYRTSGSIVTFGRYEQDNKRANGLEAIEWIVLDYEEKENKALLLSRYILDDEKYYNTENKSITWEKCTLRSWLNGEFLKAAFSAEEQAAILITAVDNSKAQGSEWSVDGGNNTQDQIFLLSSAEANKYLNATNGDKNNVGARAAATAYAIAQGVYVDDKYQTADGKPAVGGWWLRSPGNSSDRADMVGRDGAVYTSNVGFQKNVTGNDQCVRPAFWLNLESDIL